MAMHHMSTKADGADAAAAHGPPPESDAPEAHGVRMEGFSAADYCHLAEECFFLAALTKDPEVATELLKTGEAYLRIAAGWVADQLGTNYGRLSAYGWRCPGSSGSSAPKRAAGALPSPRGHAGFVGAARTEPKPNPTAADNANGPGDDERGLAPLRMPPPRISRNNPMHSSL